MQRINQPTANLNRHPGVPWGVIRSAAKYFHILFVRSQSLSIPRDQHRLQNPEKRKIFLKRLRTMGVSRVVPTHPLEESFFTGSYIFYNINSKQKKTYLEFLRVRHPWSRVQSSSCFQLNLQCNVLWLPCRFRRVIPAPESARSAAETMVSVFTESALLLLIWLYLHTSCFALRNLRLTVRTNTVCFKRTR